MKEKNNERITLAIGHYDVKRPLSADGLSLILANYMYLSFACEYSS